MPIGIPSLGVPELVLILLILLIIFGPSKIPEIARNLGLAVKELRNSISGEGEAASTQQSKKSSGSEKEKES
ncbi:twin-arginine translocation protein, TatA/E family [Aeropyrum pernix K1]|uniref:Sec-independent protein translocase protein TatA n=1 Tax=Aeropyrum pernix (strain ATCC 700893 / DSM 11879 / JCM 9820 / NBRC 100138 / K1) TaxID=272557 RepID=Q05DY4_AERPE|nr:twin-arginine translocase TatA/TatE family subunit [Aeropyrum pernix]BAF34817.1 twin-arginine translocation protein, TatA/E family [Aeropyrum pernix K1]